MRLLGLLFCLFATTSAETLTVGAYTYELPFKIGGSSN